MKKSLVILSVFAAGISYAQKATEIPVFTTEKDKSEWIEKNPEKYNQPKDVKEMEFSSKAEKQAFHADPVREKVIVTDEDTGTLGYMCEELQFGLCSKKSDIYSLGICILELWVGEIWQEGNTYKECRKETLNSLKYLECREKNLAKIIRNCILNTKRRPYIQTVIKNLRNIV